VPANAFGREDESPDWLFYRQPRFVTHIDDAAIDAVTQLYRELLPPGGAVLDLMSSWVSHLPPEVSYQRVVGLGLNRDELAANRRLAAYFVHDLNSDPRLPFATEEFDAAALCVSIQYLTRPVEVFRDVSRVVRSGAPLVITFSNRCFPTKAVAVWLELNDKGHAQLVTEYLDEAGGWSAAETFSRGSPGGDPLFAVVARRL
jgi:SAM-dependent methyltransferase